MIDLKRGHLPLDIALKKLDEESHSKLKDYSKHLYFSPQRDGSRSKHSGKKGKQKPLRKR